MSNKSELQPSEEVDERHLEPVRQAGDAYQEAVKHMIEQVAETGATTESGDYIVGFAQEEAEGMYRMKDNELEWEEPSENQNCHLEGRQVWYRGSVPSSSGGSIGFTIHRFERVI